MKTKTKFFVIIRAASDGKIDTLLPLLSEPQTRQFNIHHLALFDTEKDAERAGLDSNLGYEIFPIEVMTDEDGR